MKTALSLLVFVLTLGFAAIEAEAKRFGGGGNLGKQRAAPTQREATKDAAAAPAKPAQATPATPAAPVAQPSFMQRWGGMLAGLGIGVLLASLFGAELAPFIGALLLGLLVGGVVYLAFRLLGGARKPPPATPRVQFAGIGSALQPGSDPSFPDRGTAAPIAATAPSFEVEPFLRVAKTSFIRLQAANDAKDLDDIRDYTTPEMYAELAMQMGERGDAPQRTEVVNLNADLADSAVEDGYEIASVRFHGLIRESESAGTAPFDETWHVRKKAGDRKAPWLISGIQQN